jgi:hypothetical protein
MSKNKLTAWFIAVAALASASACGGGKRGRFDADRAKKVVTDALAPAEPTALAKVTITSGSKSTSENGKGLTSQDFWTCEGTTALEIKACKYVAKVDSHCTETPKGSTCID